MLIRSRKARVVPGPVKPKWRTVPNGRMLTWKQNAVVMSIWDLIKATLVCGGGSFLIYTYPLLGQAILIGILGLLWLFYASSTVERLRRH